MNRVKLLILLAITFLFCVIFINLMNPKIIINNDTNYNIRLYITEINSNNKSEPNIEEADEMTYGYIDIKPKDSYSKIVNLDIFSYNKKDGILIAAITKDSDYNIKLNTNSYFYLDKKGFCKYIINIYENNIEYNNKEMGLCYRKILLDDFFR